MNKWTWKYIKPASVFNPGGTLPGFYGIFERATDELLFAFYLPEKPIYAEIVQEICKAFRNDEGKKCWLVTGTMCRGEVQRDLKAKILQCRIQL